MEKEKKQDYYVVRIFNDAIQVAKSAENWTNSYNMFIEAYNVTVESVEKYHLGQKVDRNGEIKSPEPVKEIVEKIALRDELAAKEETEREAKEEAARKAKKAEELENARKEEERKRKREN